MQTPSSVWRLAESGRFDSIRENLEQVVLSRDAQDGPYIEKTLKAGVATSAQAKVET
jgi:hypothetical protein